MSILNWLINSKPKQTLPVPVENRGPVAVKSSRIPKVKLKRSYKAGETNRLTHAWTTQVTSADALSRYTLKTLRARARDLAYNNDYARRFIRMAKTNVIGKEGIRLQVRAVDKVIRDGEVVFDMVANRMIEEAWKKWGKIQHCTTTRKLTWHDVQCLVVEAMVKDGEVLLRKVKGFQNDFGFALQVLEADYLDDDYTTDLPNGSYVEQGIEFNRWDEPVAYHIFTRHPGDAAVKGRRSERVRVPAAEIVHLFITERPGQSRGTPMMISGMYRMHMLGGYEESEWTAARVSAGKMGFYITPDGDSFEGDDEDGETDSHDIIEEVEPGLMSELPEGWDFKPIDWSHPTDAFETFVKCMLRGFASGVGVNYNTLANDYQGVTYSSLRQANLDERDMWQMVQTWVAQHLHDAIYPDWLLMALTTAQIPLPMQKFDKYNNVVWRPRGWKWVDPQKDGTANAMEMSNGLKSATEIAAERGMDIEEVYQDLAREKKLREKYGIGEPEAAMVTEGVPDDGEDSGGT